MLSVSPHLAGALASDSLSVIVVIGILTTWSGMVVGQFKRNHPEVYSMDGVGYVLAGKWGREFFSVAYPLFMIFLSGSGFVAISIAFNAITTHATCTVAWVVIAMVGTFALASIQTLNKISILGWIGFVSVMAAIMIITVAVGIQDRPSAAPQTGPWEKNIAAFNAEGTFLGGMAAVSTVVFSYSGTPAVSRVLRRAFWNQAHASSSTSSARCASPGTTTRPCSAARDSSSLLTLPSASLSTTTAGSTSPTPRSAPLVSWSKRLRTESLFLDCSSR